MMEAANDGSSNGALLEDPAVNLIHSYSVRGFRPFGAEVRLLNLAKMNIIAGPNNIGKTALLLPLRRLTRQDRQFVPIKGSPDGAAHWGSSTYARWFPNDLREDGTEPEVLLAVPGAKLVPEAEPAIAKSLGKSWTAEIRDHLLATTVNISVVGRSVSFLLGDLGADFGMDEGNQKAVAAELAKTLATHIHCIVAERCAPTDLSLPDPTEHEERRSDGRELLYAVASMQLPSFVYPYVPDADLDEIARQQLSSFQGIAARTLGVESLRAYVSLPTSRTSASLMVAIGDDPPRPIRELGAGVTHVLAISMAAAKAKGGILIVEEPETGLHPGTQRRLVEALLECDAQTFITTHSNHILDVRGNDIRRFRIFARSEDGFREVQALDHRGLEALWDLGVRPSSVAEANAVIWVEGPSDAIYIRHWFSHFAPDLTEGHHYTFAFSAGSLLAHLTVEGTHDDHRIDLLNIHPGLFVVADLDRESVDEPLKPRLESMKRCLPSDRRWITDGREIEGYITDSLFVAALEGGASAEQGASLADGSTRAESGASLEKLHERLERLGCSWSGGKVALANMVVKTAARLSDAECFTPDLTDRVMTLANFIRQCQRATPPMSPPRSEEEDEDGA